MFPRAGGGLGGSGAVGALPPEAPAFAGGGMVQITSTQLWQSGPCLVRDRTCALARGLQIGADQPFVKQPHRP